MGPVPQRSPSNTMSRSVTIPRRRLSLVDSGSVLMSFRASLLRRLADDARFVDELHILSHDFTCSRHATRVPSPGTAKTPPSTSIRTLDRPTSLLPSGR
jgi:hypothetical protein